MGWLVSYMPLAFYRYFALSIVEAGPLDVSVEAGYVEPPATEFVTARRRWRRGGWSQAQSHETRRRPHSTLCPPPRRRRRDRVQISQDLGDTMGNDGGVCFRSSRPPPRGVRGYL
jgi:hypothetical protein